MLILRLTRISQAGKSLEKLFNAIYIKTPG